MISYAPLEEDPIMLPKKVTENKQPQQSECNTVVMVFIGGVILLALMDTVR